MNILAWVTIGLLAAAIAKLCYPNSSSIRGSVVASVTGVLAGGIAAVSLPSSALPVITMSFLSPGVLLPSIIAVVGFSISVAITHFLFGML